MDDRTIDKVFAGCLEELPPVSSKIVRIFTSSTFTDTALERNTLMAEVYPKIKEYCREKHGLEFQVVDMRWGVRDEATDDHMTTELCMREIANCQRLSMGPNFVVFLGQKYGYRPIPTIIVASELIMLKETLVQMGVDIHLLDLWYAKDTNAVPPVFILQPISSILVNFNNKRVPKLQSQDQAIWWDTLNKMQKLLRKAAHMCFINGLMDADAMHNYFMSVTEREVINGVLNVDVTKPHCLAYIRYINNINLQNIKKASNFIDIVNRSLDTEAARLLGDLRDDRLPNKLEATNLQKYTVEWMGREGIDKDTHDEYLTHFLAHFYRNITKLVDRAMRKEDSSAQGVILTEILQHLHACNNSVKVFYGREESLETVKQYILDSKSDKPIVLFGAGGCGKTSLLAKCAAMTFIWFKEQRNAIPLLILRFMGTTPDSSALTPMLISLCQQISYNFMLPMEDIPDDLVPLTAHFKQLLTYGTVEQPLVIFLDSVDQLTGATGANKLTWLPSKLPKHCKIVISCVYEPEDPIISADYLLLRRILDSEDNFLEVASLGENLATKVIRQWLVAGNRDVTNFQWRVVCNALSECSLPIFVKLVFAEICRWKSYSKPNDTQLAASVMDSIFKLFERIEIQHGGLLVTHALAYITAAKSGLSETELEDLISLDDKVLDDVYQYHMPPVRRIPPLLWTRIRNDLPNYLSEREADGVSVLSWYHRQFRDAAKERYFKDETMSIYFHSSIADYFAGIWGGGIPKPFRYTEIQRHRFGLQDKEGSADRKVPPQPLVFIGKDGKISRYNLRKFGELPYHLVRSKRFNDLYHQVLFNYQWLHAKLSSCPLQSCLSDFEDACLNVDDPQASREIMLVADALRLGGAILLNYPDMLGPNLIGRLLPELHTNPNVKNLLRQCDVEGINQCALVPAYHCLHTPGGPLKYSLEGHQFAVFGFCLTADYRYVVSISNKFLTWDLSTSDLCREVIPGIEGILQGLVISPDNRYGAAYSNINQIILLNMLTNEFQILSNPLDRNESITGLYLLNTHLIAYGLWSWVIFNISGEIEESYIHPHTQRPILSMNFISLMDYFMILWTGNLDDCRMELRTIADGKLLEPLHFHGALAIKSSRTKLYTCIEKYQDFVVEMNLIDGIWTVGKIYGENTDKLIQLEFSQDDKFIVGTFMFGYKAWNLETGKIVTLLLPDNGIRNISTKLLESNSCVLSKDSIYAIAGVRKNLYVWDMRTGRLLKNLDAHFGRIMKICSLTIGNWNSVITSSIDRTVKVWNINNIFEQVHVIDRHELQIDSISISSTAQVAATSTRNCVGVWDLMTGKLITKLADSPLGAIVTHGEITKDGKYIVSAESGSVIIWSSDEKGVIFKQVQEQIKQIFFIDNDEAFLTVSKAPDALRMIAIARSLPTGDKRYELEYPIKSIRKMTLTTDGSLLIGPGYEKLKDTLFIYNTKNGQLLHKIMPKYPHMKDFHSIVPVPKKPTWIALIDTDKGNIIDVKSKKFIRSVPKWGGRCTKDGKFGLYAPGRGGLELIELKHGKTIRTFIPKVAEGVFTVICMFNKTDEYVLYYHSGRKTIRVFRTSDAQLIANYRVPAELSAIDTTEDGKSVVLGTVDGCLTVLAIADPAKLEMQEYLANLPSRNEEAAKKVQGRVKPFYFRVAVRLAALAVRAKNQEAIKRFGLASSNNSELSSISPSPTPTLTPIEIENNNNGSEQQVHKPKSHSKSQSSASDSTSANLSLSLSYESGSGGSGNNTIIPSPDT